MKKIILLIILSTGLLLSIGCNDDSVSILKEQNIEIQDYLVENGWLDDAIPIGDSSVWYVIDVEGTGIDTPTISSTVTVHYEGRLLDDTKFDSSIDRGQPFISSLQNVIEGWQIGIPLFKKGGKGKLFITSEKGYGDSNHNSIPQNSVLYFEIELIDFD